MTACLHELREQMRTTADILWIEGPAGVRDEILSLEFTELAISGAPVACQSADETVFEASVLTSRLATQRRLGPGAFPRRTCAPFDAGTTPSREKSLRDKRSSEFIKGFRSITGRREPRSSADSGSVRTAAVSRNSQTRFGHQGRAGRYASFRSSRRPV